MESGAQILREWINVVREATANDIDVQDINSRDFYGLDIKQIRAKIEQRMNEWRNQKRAFHNNSANVDIFISKSGIKKSTYRVGEELLKLLFLLPYILTHGVLIRSEEPRPGSEYNLKNVLKFSATVMIDGSPRDVFVVVKNEDNKHFHYSLAHLAQITPTQITII